MVDNVYLFIPIYLVILITICLVAYFLWKSRKMRDEVQEQFSIVEIIDESSKKIEESIKVAMAEQFSPENMAVHILSTMMDIIAEPENQEPLKEAIQGLMGMGMSNLPGISAEEITAEVGEGLINTIYDEFGLVGQKILQSSLGDDWEEKVKSNPKKAISILKGYSDFGVFDLVNSLKSKFQSQIPGFGKRNPSSESEPSSSKLTM